MPRRVLVTGGCGFIGSHLVGALLARGDEVLCLDNLDDYYDPRIKRANIAEYLETDGFEFVEGDIRDAALLDRLAGRGAIDAIVHLAARAGVRPSIEHPALYADVNLAGTSNVLELARKGAVRDFIFASSSSVYGERREIPFRECDRVDHPVSPYAATKKGGELLCHAYHHLYGLNVACLRFFTVYGPRQRPEMAIHKFIARMRSGETVPMYGDGSAQRDFTYVDDIVAGMLRALDRSSGYAVYNLGNHRMVTLREMIDTIAEALGVEPRIEALPMQPGDVSRTCADLELARTALGYEPRTTFGDGIRRTVEWYERACARDEVTAPHH